MEALTPVDVLSLVVVGVQVSCLAYEGAVMGVVAKGVISPHFDSKVDDDEAPQHSPVMMEVEVICSGY